jgi:hypothetical protein
LTMSDDSSGFTLVMPIFFFVNNRFFESIQCFTVRIDLAINRNRNNRFLK